MKSVNIEYGDGLLPIEVPETAVVPRYKETYFDPPAAADPVAAIRKALANPLGMDPLGKLAKNGSKVVIAFPDRVKGGSHAQAHRRLAIPIIVEELKRAGVRDRDILLLCAIGLHKKNTKEEFDQYLGREIVDVFWPDRIKNHDAEDPEGIVQLGRDEMGNPVCVNKDIYEADLAVMIGHTQGNPYGGYSGGYKMCVTGVTDWRSIGSHHCPATMHREDFVPVNTERSHMRRQFDSIGRAMEKGMGKKFFLVDAVLGAESQILAVYAGAAAEVQKASWPLARQRTEVVLDIKEKFDVMVFGLPRTFHYGPGMGTNPILMLQACGSQVARNLSVLREGGVVIAASVCDGWFNDEWFPSYREVYTRLQGVDDLAQAAAWAEEIATRPEYIRKYRHEFAYHPFHALSMVAMGGVALRHTSAIYVVGAKEPQCARGMRMRPVDTFAEALGEAAKIVGRDPRMLVIPEAFTRTAVHFKMP